VIEEKRQAKSRVELRLFCSPSYATKVIRKVGKDCSGRMPEPKVWIVTCPHPHDFVKVEIACVLNVHLENLGVGNRYLLHNGGERPDASLNCELTVESGGVQAGRMPDQMTCSACLCAWRVAEDIGTAKAKESS